MILAQCQESYATASFVLKSCTSLPQNQMFSFGKTQNLKCCNHCAVTKRPTEPQNVTNIWLTMQQQFFQQHVACQHGLVFNQCKS